MFEDVKGKRPRSSDLGSASDRRLLAAIVKRKDIGDLTSVHLWGELYRRYPQEPRFLLLTLFESLSEPPIPGTSPSAHFIRQAEKIATAAPELHGLIADLLTVGEPALRHDMALAETRDFRELRRRVAPPGYGPDDASSRLERLAREVVAEYHDRSAGDRPFFAPEPRPAVSAPSVEKEYAPDVAFAVGDRMRHPKFGVGTVTAVADGKLHVQFPQGPKTLAGVR